MAKDRARPFSRKHRRYWMTVTGGMIVIGAIDLALGYIFWPHRDDEGLPPQAIRYDVKQVPPDFDARPADAAPALTPTTR